MKIIVYGAVGPQGSKRFVGINKRTGRGQMIESSALVRPWREAVIFAAREVMQGAPALDGPLSVDMTFTLRKPASAPKKRKTWPDRKPDIDKCIRSTADALVMAGAIADDARIVIIAASKVFPNEGVNALDVPGVVIEVEQLT